jgi:hypothetical protein
LGFMTAKTIIMFLPGLSDSDLEVVLARIEKILMWRAEDKLDEFEAPAYSYWARGYPDGPWAMPEGSPERDKWEVRRAFFNRNVERYAPTIREQALSATVRRKWRWPWQRQ